MTPERIEKAVARLNRGFGFAEPVVPVHAPSLKIILDALESAQKEIADLKRGGCVVPGLRDCGNCRSYQVGATVIRCEDCNGDEASNWEPVQPIPADRVVVDRAILDRFLQGCHDWMPGLGRCGDQEPGGKRQLCPKCDALREQAKGVEGLRNPWRKCADELPEDGANVCFVTECPNDKWYHGRVLGGRFMAGEFGGFSVPGLMVRASHWCPMPAFQA